MRIPSLCAPEFAPALACPLQTSCSFCLSTFTFIALSHESLRPLFPVRCAAAIRDENKIHRRTILPQAVLRSCDFARLHMRKSLRVRVEIKSLDSEIGLSD